METGTDAAFEQKVAWLREAAGERFDMIELHALVLDAIVTDNRRQAAEEIIAGYHALPPGVVSNVFPDYNAILASPYALVGTVDQIVADLQERRERYGISYVTLPSNSIDALGPVVERLAGT